ncbi:hypothetical protein STRCI_007290 [Streptomyces cinnabarinus]|uniref:Ferredoxin n=1 Tax=Streptomyces cinnabarinus TaxID=67287 RepID=A0ABY7KMI4_9ACTN|nr:hypothetical protein [Streptomyces cinnabarinus]WAZ25772.1 hypothetical protein STRCI_007290 [Streptomyces cinnabarinus]
MTTSAENGFSIDTGGVTVNVPHRDDGKWTVKEILDLGQQQYDWAAKKKCPCGGICMLVPEGTLIEVPEDGDPLQMKVVSPVEVAKRQAENRLWLDASE